MTYEQAAIAAIWCSVALLAGGFARTRNRSAWTWFVLSVVLGPIAILMLVTWPPREQRG